MRSAPESRSATFLMTDIEGSTRLWEEEPGAMGAALAVHDTILRDAVESVGGTVVKTTGDGMLAAFDTARAAVDAAANAQRAVCSQKWPTSRPLRVRMAIHSGSAESRDGDFFGPALNRVARLLAIGHGGQVLVTAAGAAVVADELPADFELLDRGEHRLRDLARPDHIYQLAGPGLETDFPPLRSGRAPTNLPAELTTFVGREREVNEVRTLLQTHRLVSMVGVGGTGKTRLMLRVATELAGLHPDGVWLVELAPISDPDLVTAEVARALAIPDQRGRSPEDVICDFLREKDLLLLVDNCEHLIEAAADLVGRVTSACRLVHVLTTSREALGVPGEAVFQVPSLGLPKAAGLDDPEAVAASEAVRLFVDRATATLPTFRLEPATIESVAEICRRLDGIPLALELAAARVNVMSVGEIAQGLGDRFRLLAGGRRTSVARQQTLQALIDWSWDLLSEPDQRLLRRLSVFAGGWTLDAAAAVTSDETGPMSRLDTLDGLGRLVDRSLVVAEHEGVTRFRMLETIRQYGSQKLIASGEAIEMRTRHLDWFRLLCEAAQPGLEGSDMIVWLSRIDAEIDNVRGALDWALEVDPEAAVVIAGSLGDYWRVRATGPEATDRFARVIEALDRLPEPAAADRAARLVVVSRLLAKGAREAAMTNRRLDLAPHWAEEGEKLARESGEPGAVAQALTGQMFVALFAGKPSSRVPEIAAELVTYAERSGDWANATFAAGATAQYFGASDDARAEQWVVNGIEWAQRSGQPFAIGLAALTRGRLFGLRGNPDAATPCLLQASAQFRVLGDGWMEVVSSSEIGHALRRGGRLDEALDAYREVLPRWYRIGHRGAVANLFEAFAFIAADQGDGARAAVLLGAAEHLRIQASSEMMAAERAEYDIAVARLRAAIGDEAMDRGLAEGARFTTEEAVAFARS